MSLASKLNLKPGMKARVVGKPADVDLADVSVAASGEAVIVFASGPAPAKRMRPRRGVSGGTLGST